jgi:CRP-like cAMP-binding protein
MTEQKYRTVDYPAGYTIFSAGDFCGTLYIIKSGQIELYRQTPDGKQVPVAIVSSGEYLGELAIIDDEQRHSLTAVALTPVEAICLSRKVIEEQIKSAPPWLVALTKGLVLKLRNANEVIRRNNVVDKKLVQAIAAAEENEQRRRGEKK